MMRKIVVSVIAATAVAAMNAPGVAHAQADDRTVLSGVKELKVAFDLLEGDAKGLLNRLNVIDETRASLIRI